MAYFKDLSDYEYTLAPLAHSPAKNIGWLAKEHSFETAEPSAELLEVLRSYCTVQINQTRGLYRCPFCLMRPQVDLRGLPFTLGSAEIRVFSENGVVYAAPNLIYHYVAAHRYHPPAEFLRAVAKSPHPPAGEYFSMLKAAGYE
jgi:hypothetical protein